MARPYRPDKHLAYNNESTHGMEINKDRDWVALKRRITYLGEPAHEWDATTKFYVDSQVQNCLNLDPPKNKFDVGGNPLTGLPMPTTDTDAISLKYFQDTALTQDTLQKTLDDFATIKYVDDEIQKLSQSQSQDQDDDDLNQKVDLSLYYTSDEIDLSLLSLKEDLQNEDDLLDTKINGVEASLDTKINQVSTDLNAYKQTKIKHFLGPCTHNNEDRIEFPKKPTSSHGRFSVSSDTKTLTFRDAGVWEITLIDQVKEGKLKRAEMKFTNMDVIVAGGTLFEDIPKSSKWTSFYFSRIVPLKANATLQIHFEGRKSDVGFDGTNNSKIIIKQYL